MKSAEEMLRDAVAAYQAGHLATAEVGYRRVLRKRPNDHLALSGLALLSFQAGARQQAIDYLVRSLASEPNVGLSWNLLGILYSQTGKPIEAKAAFRRATEVSPELCEFWCNLAGCMREEGDFRGAEEQLRRALSCPPPQSKAYEGLTDLLCKQGRLQEALQTVLEWLSHEPTNPIARHIGAALSRQEPPSRASDEYVQTYFDAFADAFDLVLARLNYRAPELIALALRAAGSRRTSVRPFSAMLDAGCGTGLCGPLVRELCGSLVGVDLSTRMLHYAKRRGCYDELVTGELGAFMRSRPQAFDAILCADTLVYFGALAQPLAAAHESLRAGGPLVFTVEALVEPDGADHRLDVSGRYAHSETYLRRVLRESGFMVESIARQIVRQEVGRDVSAYLVVGRRS
jgi:predicted TPR repeat methyltransferase